MFTVISDYRTDKTRGPCGAIRTDDDDITYDLSCYSLKMTSFFLNSLNLVYSVNMNKNTLQTSEHLKTTD